MRLSTPTIVDITISQSPFYKSKEHVLLSCAYQPVLATALLGLLTSLHHFITLDRTVRFMLAFIR